MTFAVGNQARHCFAPMWYVPEILCNQISSRCMCKPAELSLIYTTPFIAQIVSQSRKTTINRVSLNMNSNKTVKCAKMLSKV